MWLGSLILVRDKSLSGCRRWLCLKYFDAILSWVHEISFFMGYIDLGVTVFADETCLKCIGVGTISLHKSVSQIYKRIRSNSFNLL